MLRGALTRRAICRGKHAAGTAVRDEARLLLLLELLAQLVTVHQPGSRRMAQGQQFRQTAGKQEAAAQGAAVENLIISSC